MVGMEQILLFPILVQTPQAPLWFVPWFGSHRQSATFPFPRLVPGIGSQCQFATYTPWGSVAMLPAVPARHMQLRLLVLQQGVDLVSTSATHLPFATRQAGWRHVWQFHNHGHHHDCRHDWEREAKGTGSPDGETGTGKAGPGTWLSIDSPRRALGLLFTVEMSHEIPTWRCLFCRRAEVGQDSRPVGREQERARAAAGQGAAEQGMIGSASPAAH